MMLIMRVGCSVRRCDLDNISVCFSQENADHVLIMVLFHTRRHAFSCPHSSSTVFAIW